MSSKPDILLKGPSVNIVRRCGPCLSDILESKFGCIATIDGVEFEDTVAAHQTGPTASHEKRFDGTLPAGVRVSVWKADLTKFSADAVVNAANESLQHYGGLALALSRAGGPQIQTESDRHISVRTGEAIVTTAGMLNYKMIIHAVGPQLPSNPRRHDVDQAEPLLERTIFNILDRVKENHLETVAIPAISSGIFCYPLPQCADTIVKAVKRYYEKFQSYLPKEILLVNNDEPTVSEMVRACHMILSHQHQQHTSYSGAAASNSRDGGKTSPPSVQIGGVRLILMKGKIEEQTTDVIVNATNDRQGNGQISTALLRKAGHEIRRELNAAPMFGSVAVTNAYKLQCRQVYHIFYPQAVTEQEAQQCLFVSVTDCLQAAAAHCHKSIAFPAIGTGGWNLGRTAVAQLTTQAVINFAQQHQQKMDVCFVIFPSDNDTFKAFEQQFKNLQPKTFGSWEKSKDYNIKSEHSLSKTRAPPPPPHIRVMGPTDAAVCEATHWLSGLLFKFTGPVVIHNNFILHFGEEEYRQLTRLPGVSIKEEFDKSQASIAIHGHGHEAVAVAVLQVEAMLCTIQNEFIKEEESDMLQSTQNRFKSVSVQREKMDHFGPLFADKKALFNRTGLQIAKVDEVKNATLQTLFDLKKNQVNRRKTQKMYQRIPAQFIDLVSRVGFHTECAPPDAAAYGQGIYFTDTVTRALEVWKVSDEEYVHFVEAEVLVGESTPGKPEFILPPALKSDPLQMYDSVSGPGIAVIFSSYQALPKYIITCKKI